MADISMCTNIKCEKRDRCYRYRAVPEKDYQHYNDFTEICFTHDRKWFWQIRGDEKLRSIEEIEKEGGNNG